MKVALAVLAAVVLLGFAVIWRIRDLNEPRYEGRTMAQWLKILASKPGNSGSPMDIVCINVDATEHTMAVEVPLSYALVWKYDFTERNGKIYLILDGDWKYPIYHAALGETNGNCLLQMYLGTNEIPSGPHTVAAELVLFGSHDRTLSARGSTQIINFDGGHTPR